MTSYGAVELNAVSRAVTMERARRKYRRLVDFVRASWPLLESDDTAYRHNWHIDLLCEYLEAFRTRDIEHLLVNVPPGTMKSLICSVCFHPWVWTTEPAKRFLTASYGGDLATRDAVRSRELIGSDWYRGLWGTVVQIDKRNDSKTRYHNTAGGWRIATSVGGRATGEHPDFKIVDDPHNVKEAESDVEREAALTWHDLTISARGASRGAGELVIMQRLHARDLSGHIMSLPDFPTNWRHICIPMEAEDAPRMPRSTQFPNDPRKAVGELLWPELFPKPMLEVLKQRLGEYGTAGQMQQRPNPPGGGVLKVGHFRLWPHDQPLPDLQYVVQSYDTAFTEQTQNDPTACEVWGIFQRRIKRGDAVTTVNCALLLDAWDERMGYPALRERVIEDYRATYGGQEQGGGFKPEHPPRRPDLVLVEDKGSGISLLQDLRLGDVPARAYNPGKADKLARAHIAAPILELGVLYVLESGKQPGKPVLWAREFIKQLEEFNKGEHDDYVDAFTQCIIMFKNDGWLTLPAVPQEPVLSRDYHAEKQRRRNPYGA
jgi:predicted phage terminase large subunit-like protein